MVRTADHEARRRQIADAVHRLVAKSGLDAATVAAVAREAGCSVGLVQHYFPGKDALLRFTCEQVMAGVNDRIQARIAEGVEGGQPIRAVVHGGLTEILPVDEARRAEHRVRRTFAARALDSPALAEVARTMAADYRGQLAGAVKNGKECGEVAPDLDAERTATGLMALVEGLADQLYHDPGRCSLGSVAEDLLRSYLDGIFTGECRQYGRGADLGTG
ncbi:TetR family transcriptional regulator [Saccharomonospora piscinae]|uniref:TetR family transcriptional regulator n=1 Tax=Saccharomonospora piscinae TaxID=687388 RepID=A0A1V9A604_SACPI|nr:TetR family transcriptional regulator C-terminal domain-containing protein [Saccharomonospora piscinae]OQO92466.1 TetR family transcriptional regulator [Saccharomonospora piscinae]